MRQESTITINMRGTMRLPSVCLLPGGFVLFAQNVLAQTIPDPRPEQTIQPPYFWLYVVCGILLGGLLVWGGIYFIGKALKKKYTVVPPSPYEVAMKALVETKPLMRPDSAKEFVFAVTVVLRRYIEERLGFPALECTTEEFVSQAVEHPVLKGELADKLKPVMVSTDLVKYARQDMADTAMQDLYEKVEAFVNEAEKKAAQSVATPKL